MIYKFRQIAFALFTCLALINFTACGEDNDPTPDPDPTPETTTATIRYVYTCDPDLLLVADITVSYLDAEGKEITETIKEKEWEMIVSNVKLPFSASLNVVHASKEDFTVDPEKDSYNIAEKLYIYQQVDKDSWLEIEKYKYDLTCPSDNLIDYLNEKLSQRDRKITAELKN